MATLAVLRGRKEFPERLCGATFASSKNWLIGSLLLVVFGGGGRTGLGAELVDQQLRQRLLSEAVPTWQRMRAVWLEDVACNYEERYFVVYQNEAGQWQQFVHSSDGSYCFAGQYRLIQDGRGLVIRLTNPEYTALIGRRSSDAPYILEEGLLASSREPIPLQRQEKIAFFLVAGATRAAAKPLETVLTSNDFQLLRLVEEKQPGGPKVRLEFRYTLDPPIGSATYATEWVELDPNNFWLKNRGGRQYSNGVVHTYEYEYGPPYRGFPFLKRLRTVARNTTPGREKEYDETTYTFGDPRPANYAKEVFYLEHYGIPRVALEKVSPRRFPTLLIYWIGIVGIVVATGIFLYAWRRRSQHNG